MMQRRNAVALALALSMCAATIVACKEATKDSAPAAGKGGKGSKSGLTFAVDVLPVESKKVDYEVDAPGTVEAFEHVQVTARVAGPVDKVAFAEGQLVKAGDTLVVIDSQRYAAALNSAQAALAKAKAQVADNQAMVARRKAASANHPGLIPEEEIATYETQVLTSQADEGVAVANLRAAQLNVEDSTARAPMDGIIQTRTVETGQYVQAGTVMATLLRNDPMLLEFSVEPSDAPRITPGMVATFTMRETQRTYQAKISLVSQSADPTNHMVGITGDVVADSHNFWLRPGSFCDVVLKIGAARDAPLIPRTAARATDHGYVAYVVVGDVAHEHVLTLGMSTKDGWLEVRSGINAGDQLVVRGAEALSEGSKVKANPVTAASLALDGGAGGDTTNVMPPQTAPSGGAPALPAMSAGSAPVSAGGPKTGGAAR